MNAPRSRLPLLTLLEISLFVSLFCGTVLLYPAWYHHNLITESPVMGSPSLVDRWVTGFEHRGGARCLASSIDTKVHELPAGEGWFADFKCNTPEIYGRLAAIFVVPGFIAFWILVAALGMPAYRKSAPSRRL